MSEFHKEHWDRIEELFMQAMALPVDQRQALLDAECAEDEDMRREVHSLLAAAAGEGNLIEEAVQDASRELTQSPHTLLEGRIGNYRILRLLGQGGMGSVYLAAREDEIDVQVAIKVMHGGPQSLDSIAGFAAERKILASLDHPCIARFLDAGQISGGPPYLVMEYVDGRPLVEYCQHQNIGIAGRLGIFRKVCEAVRYAHQNLVVHRDIKPANILVTAAGEPKLLDFGIAKLLDTEAASDLRTLTVLRRLTPAYSSPEQIRGERITTASDIYTLGVLLFELLTEARPYELTGKTISQIEKVICQDAPLAPSSFRPELRGDLETIILKAMHKEPHRRYRSAGELSEDIERYLGNYPIRARGDSWMYRTRKFVRRNPWGVGAAAAVLVMIIAFGVTMAVLFGRIRQERDTAEQTAQFLVNVFREADPTHTRGNQVTAREVLENASKRISNELGGQPLVKAQLLFSLGLAFESLGQYDRSIALLKESVDLRRSTLGRDHWNTSESLLAYSDALSEAGRFPEAEEAARETVAIRRKIKGPRDLSVAVALRTLAEVHRSRGKYEEAEAESREALAILREGAPLDEKPIAGALQSLAKVLLARGQLEAAEPLMREAAGIYRKAFGADSPELATSLNNFGLALRDKGDYSGAAPLLEEAHSIYRKVYGEEHGYTAIALSNVGGVKEVAGQFEEAVKLLRRAYEIHVKAQREGHPFIARAEGHLAHALYSAGRTKEAEEAYRETLRRWGKSDSTTASQSMSGFAELLADEGRYSEAGPLFQQALAIVRKRHPAGHPIATPLLSVYGLMLVETRRPAEAEPLLQEALELTHKRLPARHYLRALAQTGWAAWLGSQGRMAEAESLAAEALSRLQQQPGAQSPEARRAQKLLDKLKKAGNRS